MPALPEFAGPVTSFKAIRPIYGGTQMAVDRMPRVRISAKADYAVRAALELAAAEEPPVKGERLADAQGIPLKFLENILGDLRQAGLVVSQRGPDGGYKLERPPE